MSPTVQSTGAVAPTDTAPTFAELRAPERSAGGAALSGPGRLPSPWQAVQPPPATCSTPSRCVLRLAMVWLGPAMGA